MAAVNQISEDISGTGWKLILKPDQEEDPEEKKEIELFLNNVNPKQSIKELLYCCFVDYQLLGGLNIEVSRFFNGKIAELYHVPEKTLYVHKSLHKFAQYYVSKYAWFVPFEADPQKRLNIHAKTGEKGKFDFETQGHELIRHINYNPRSSFYGLAPLTSAISSILNLIESSQFHLSFLTSRGIPEYMISLSGKWEEGAAKKITNFIRTEMQGEHFKSMVLNLPEAGSVKFDKLAVDIKSSEFLLELADIAREDVLAVYRIPPSRLCLFKKGGSLSSNIYSESNRTYWESVVLPNQMIAEKIVNKILEGALGQESRYHFEILDLDLRTETEDIKNYKELFAMAAMTPNQIRTALGKPVYEGGDQYYVSRSFIPLSELTKSVKKLRARESEMDEREIKLIEAMTEFESGLEEVSQREEM
jgi:phage portal protein BeeE